MTQLSVEISEEQSRFVQALVNSGDFADANTLVTTALSNMQADSAKLLALRQAIQEGFDSGIYEGDPFADVAREMGWDWED